MCIVFIALACTWCMGSSSPGDTLSAVGHRQPAFAGPPHGSHGMIKIQATMRSPPMARSRVRTRVFGLPDAVWVACMVGLFGGERILARNQHDSTEKEINKRSSKWRKTINKQSSKFRHIWQKLKRCCSLWLSFWFWCCFLLALLFMMSIGQQPTLQSQSEKPAPRVIEVQDSPPLFSIITQVLFLIVYNMAGPNLMASMAGLRLSSLLRFLAQQSQSSGSWSAATPVAAKLGGHSKNPRLFCSKDTCRPATEFMTRTTNKLMK